MSPAQRLKVRRSKTATVRKSPKSIFKLGVLFLTILILGFVGFKLYSSWLTRLWIPGSRVTIVVATENPKIYSYNPADGKLTIIEVPQNTQVDASYSYGTWQAHGLWGFGFQEGKKGNLLRASLQKSLGLPIDGWVDAQGEKLFTGATLDWPQALFQAVSSASLKTNLTFFDRMSLLLKVGTVGTSERENYSLEKQGVIKKTKLQDGSDGYVIIPEKAKAELEFLHDDRVFSEAQRVVVVNTTRTSGLATSVATVATTLGVRVIGTQSSDEQIGDCTVRGPKEKLNTLSSLRMVKVFGCKTQVKELSGPEDLEIVLGADFAKRY